MGKKWQQDLPGEGKIVPELIENSEKARAAFSRMDIVYILRFRRGNVSNRTKSRRELRTTFFNYRRGQQRCLSRAVSNYANNNINLPRNSNETPPPILYVELIQRVTPRFINANVSGGRNKFREIKSKTSN